VHEVRDEREDLAVGRELHTVASMGGCVDSTSSTTVVSWVMHVPTLGANVTERMIHS
jgi:hypothetical protein